MQAVFFDLETTDKNPIGQILNYSFILVDQSLQPQGELNGLIRISRLEIPSPEAILANRTNVLTHQESACDSEAQAACKIAQFFKEVVQDEPGKTVLVGFNSNRFDVPYLRTTLIRNGINPYFGGKLLYRDLLLVAKKLSLARADFPRSARVDAADESKNLLSLSLENLTQKLGLLSGRQAHSSRDDVLLTIELAKAFRSRFGCDVLAYDPYEVRAAHNEKPGTVFWHLSPNRDLTSPELVQRTPYSLHAANYRSSLWVDLKAYAEGKGRQSLRWYNANQGAFFGGGEETALGELLDLAKKAQSEFASITLENFFTPSSCDIEQDIYRIDISRIELLAQAIWGHNQAPVVFKDRDSKVLYTRHKMANFAWSGGTLADTERRGLSPEDLRMRRLLHDYALYRYGGKLQMVKAVPEAQEREARNLMDRELYHKTSCELTAQIEQLSKAASQEDAILLHALRDFIFSSDIYRVAGSELASLQRAADAAACHTGTPRIPLEQARQAP